MKYSRYTMLVNSIVPEVSNGTPLILCLFFFSQIFAENYSSRLTLSGLRHYGK